MDRMATDLTPQQIRIKLFRENPIKQQALLRILSEEQMLGEALAICENEKVVPPIPLDASELMSVRAAAKAHGATRVLDILYSLATPMPTPPVEESGPGHYGVENLSDLPPDPILHV
jgi:hypothetical protein